MNRNLKSIALAAICICASFAAGAQTNGFYLRPDLGGQWTRNTELKEFFGESLAPGSRVKFDPGIRFGVGAGYQLTDWFAGEAQIGVMTSQIKSITGADRLDAYFSNIPLLANVRLQLPKSKCPIQPYIGGGAGVSAAVIDADHIDINGTHMDGAASDAVFAYQAFGGIRYQLNHHMGLSLEYRYFATTQPTWKAESTSGTGTDKLRFGGIDTHAVSIAFDYTF